MTKKELNQYAIDIAMKAFKEKGYRIEDTSLPASQVNFLAISNGGRKKVKVKSITQIGSYIFIFKRLFNIKDPDLYMVVVFIPANDNKRELYLIPAIEWGKDVYPFTGKNYNKSGQISEPEWGISFSAKAKDALELYRFYFIN